MTTRVFLVDASIYVFRAWYSLRPELIDRDGFPAHAVYGFTGFLCSLLEQTNPRHIALCFDESLDRSFRNDIYPQYKANREPPPTELRRQFNHCQAVAEAMGLSCLSHQSYEADDLIGTLAHRKRKAGHAMTIVSCDKDLLQLLAPGDRWWDFARQRRLEHQDVVGHIGVEPGQVADFLALTGDAVDNIPGVPGIGAKTAAALLAHFGSLDTLLARIEEVDFLSIRGARSVGRRLRENLEQLALARRLTAIALDAPIGEPEPTLLRREADLTAIEELFDYLRFGRLLRQRIAALASDADPLPAGRRPAPA